MKTDTNLIRLILLAFESKETIKPEWIPIEGYDYQSIWPHMMYLYSRGYLYALYDVSDAGVYTRVESRGLTGAGRKLAKMAHDDLAWRQFTASVPENTPEGPS
jgi:hypothetical protein